MGIDEIFFLCAGPHELGSDARQGVQCILLLFMACKTSSGVRRVETNAEPKDDLMIDVSDVSRFLSFIVKLETANERGEEKFRCGQECLKSSKRRIVYTADRFLGAQRIKLLSLETLMSPLKGY